MAITYFQTNSVTTGTLISWAADGDEVYVLPGVTVASTTANTISFGSRNDIQLVIGGSVASNAGATSTGAGVHVTLLSGGSLISLAQFATTTPLSFTGLDATVTNDGTISAVRGIGIAMVNGTIHNSGLIDAASGIVFGTGGTSGRALINSGRIQANDFDNANQTGNFNSGVSVQSGFTQIQNLAGGVISTLAANEAGVKVVGVGTSVVINNQGEISAIRGFGIDLAGADSAGIVVSNSGTISGFSTSIVGSAFADKVTNGGLLVGNVQMGTGIDGLVNSGRLEGNWFGGNDGDAFAMAGAGVVIGSIFGDAGNDTLTGGMFDDRLFGGGDNDTLSGAGGDDVLDGGSGNARIFGGDGDDTISSTGALSTDTIIVLAGAGDDSMEANAATVFIGGSGDDQVRMNFAILAALFASGEDGDDTLIGGDSVDELIGGAGNDELTGDSAGDNLRGDGGEDTIFGGNGADTIFGGDGHDEIDTGTGDDLVRAGAGDDTIDSASADSFDSIQIFGDDGNDSLTGGESQIQFFGGAGDDRAFVSSASLEVFFALGGDGVDELFGGGGTDRLSGGDDGDFVYGGAASDSLRGGAGDDLVDGGLGNDTIRGDGGDDTLTGDD
ncbi:MAG: calcium-binding protein, partial [Paracoccaceae bacterium]